MSTTPNQPQGGEPAGEPAESPLAFDKEAARRRYRATMRGPFMRLNYVLLALIILAATVVIDLCCHQEEESAGHDH